MELLLLVWIFDYNVLFFVSGRNFIFVAYIIGLIFYINPERYYHYMLLPIELISISLLEYNAFYLANFTYYFFNR